MTLFLQHRSITLKKVSSISRSHIFFFLSCSYITTTTKRWLFNSNDIRWLVVLFPRYSSFCLNFQSHVFLIFSFHARTHASSAIFLLVPRFPDLCHSLFLKIFSTRRSLRKTLRPRETTRRSKILILRFTSISVCGSVCIDSFSTARIFFLII